MTRTNRCIGFLLAALVAVLASGCPKKGTEDGKAVQGQADWSAFKKKPAALPDEKKVAPAPPQKKEIPKVNLTKDDEATCLVKVGDAMPEGQLPGLDGKAVPLRTLFGGKAAVVLFWSGTNPYARQAMRRLGEDVVEPFGDKGVRIVAIDVKEKPDAVRKAVEEAGAKFANLVDADGAYFSKVSTGKLPRVYLLDPAGKVLWFDIEYSGVTRASLQQAIGAVLDAKP
jgi:peroxiredoxin